jgi:aminoglycoside phosphotransferase (APT) family kinase protein
MDYQPRVVVIEEGLEKLIQAGYAVEAMQLMTIIKNCESAFPGYNSCIIHGDFHQRHILVKDHHISGIIDWGDVSFGCPAMDLSILFTLFPRRYHHAFWKIYGEVSWEIQQQALFRSIYSNVLLALYALNTHYPKLLHSALQGLKNCLNNRL